MKISQQKLFKKNLQKSEKSYLVLSVVDLQLRERNHKQADKFGELSLCLINFSAIWCFEDESSYQKASFS